MRSPFAIFRKHQKVLMVVLTGLAMFAFVFLDAAFQSGGTFPWLLGAILGCGLFWIIGTQLGKANEFAMVGVIVGAAVGFAGQRLAAPPPEVETSLKNFNRREVQDLVQRRMVANEFVSRAFMQSMPETAPRQMPPGLQFGFGLPLEQDVILAYLLRQEANDMGMEISDRAIESYIKQITNNNLGAEEFTNVRRDLRLSESQLFDILRDELLARRAAVLQQPRLHPTPDAYWDHFCKLNVRQSMDVAEVPAAAFLDQVPEPSEADLRQLFDQYRDQLPNAQGLGRPGFFQPRRVALAYLEADAEAFRKKIKPVTEQDVTAYYEANKEQYRNRPLPDDFGTGDTAPGDGPMLPDFTPDGGTAGTTGDGPAIAPRPQTAPQPKPEEGDPPESSDSSDNDDSSSNGNASPDGAPSQSGGTPPAQFSLQDNLSADDSADGDDPQETTPPANRSADRGAEADAATDADSPAVANQPGAEAANDSPPADDTPADPPLPEYRPLDDSLKTEIRLLLERRRLRTAMQQTVEAAMNDVMFELGDQYRIAVTEEDDVEATRERIAEQMRAYAKEHGLTYAETELLTQQELLESEEHPVGSATEPVDNELNRPNARRVVETIFSSRPDQAYDPYIAEGATDSWYAFWKIADREAYQPEFTDPGIREQVLEAWREIEAAKFAEQRAQELKQTIGEKNLVDVLAGKTVTGAEGDDADPLLVLSESMFSWLSTTTAPQEQLSFAPMPVLSRLATVNRADQDFMRFVFEELNVGDVGVVPNADRSAYYVVQVTERTPEDPASAEDFKQRFMKERFFGMSFFGQRFPSTYDFLVDREAEQLANEWSRRLVDKYGVRWNESVAEGS